MVFFTITTITTDKGSWCFQKFYGDSIIYSKPPQISISFSLLKFVISFRIITNPNLFVK